ncbi:MAG: hypothetical protein EBU90_12290 [Proteobacteria bacterium]|nr:hypothetical protein [Pseudomonadota bacterium]
MKRRKKNIILADSKYKNLHQLKQQLFRSAKKRALKKELEFTIELEDIYIPQKCPILKVPLICSTRYSPSIDRIFPDKGYIKGNIAVISTLANSMKANATPKELLIFSRNIKKYMDLFEEVEVEELPQPPDPDEIRKLMNED